MNTLLVYEEGCRSLQKNGQ